MKNKTVFCIMGESGSGKTEITKELHKRGYNVLQSYTTRQPREENEFGHLFCTVEEYENFKENDQIVAYSFFNNHHYFSTKQQMYECDIYVVDPDGIQDLRDNIDDIDFITIYLNVPKETRYLRMVSSRGVEVAVERIVYDEVKFKDKQFEYAVINEDFDTTVNIIEYTINQYK
jgi:guanylate kinase